MKRIPLLLLIAAIACSCSTLSNINWDYNHLANAGGKAVTAAMITDDQVTIDLNHPYAGEDLHFKGVILSIRDVTEGELKAIRNPHHCGKCHGKCDDCDSGCGSCKQ